MLFCAWWVMGVGNGGERKMVLYRFFINSWGKLWHSLFSVGQQSAAKENVSVPNIKVWSTFSKVVGVGNAHKCFMLSQILIAKRLAAWRFEHNGESLKSDSKNKSERLYFISLLPINYLCVIIKCLTFRFSFA